MPTDACQFFYDCINCGALLRPKAGDCCVFCSYGSVVCPPVQAAQPCCSGLRSGSGSILENRSDLFVLAVAMPVMNVREVRVAVA